VTQDPNVSTEPAVGDEPEATRTTGGNGAGAAPPVEAVRRALRILSLFEPTSPELGISDVARRLGMHKSTVHRLLATMQAEGFVYQTAGGQYALTWKVLQLSAARSAHRGLREAVLHQLEPLAQQTGETAHLAVLDGRQVLYVEKVESRHQLRMPSAVGRHVPLHATALGKVLAAGLDEATVSQLLFGHKLEAFTPTTLTRPQDVLSELDKVRDRGYAVDNEEIEYGLTCVAAPVLGPQGETCAAISIAGPTSRVAARAEEYAQAVRTACDQLSAALGSGVMELRTLTPNGAPA
jgi:DNA-binding IclR family transcriptional regulator